MLGTLAQSVLNLVWYVNFWSHSMQRSQALLRHAGRSGYTLVEIMIVVTLIGLLTMMAMPHYRRVRDYSQQNVCISNLRVISTAKAQFAIEGRRQNGDPVLEVDINPYMRKPFADLVEPAGFAYQIQSVGLDATCTLGAPHEL